LILVMQRKAAMAKGRGSESSAQSTPDGGFRGTWVTPSSVQELLEIMHENKVHHLPPVP
jgi:uncharacterized protein YdeI (BOF family)